MYTPSYSSNSSLVTASKENPCPHCGKPDWCYFIGELSVCNRENPPAEGWVATTKTNSEGRLYYAPIQERKEVRAEQTRYWEYPARDGSPLVRVKRIDDGNGKKTISQQRWDGSRWVPGLGNIDRANIPVYRLQDVQKAIAENQLVFIVEGEPCADLLWNLGLAATCNIGGSGKWRPTDSKDLTGAQVVICPDRDVPGVKHAEQIAQDFPEAQWLYPYPESWFWDNLPKNQGLDVVDWVDDKNLSAENLINSITPRPRTQENVVCQKYDSNNSDYIPDTAQVAEQNFTQKAETALYTGTHWVSIGGQLYRFVGTHYELQPEAEEKRRIGNWLNTYSEKVRGKYVCNRATSSSVAEVLNWVVNRTAIDPSKINPGGLNCSNGVVRVNPDGTHTFTPHNPELVYTYVGGKYDPDADVTDCDRLLECLAPSHREIFFRTAAASLDLKLVRKRRGRDVKGLLCYGDGNNGKDTLRNALAAVLGRGMTGKTLSDFKSYDTGRKFTLAGIEESLCNWSSENTSTVSLDSLQSLKQLITGDTLDIERKGKDSFPCNPNAIFLANCNKLPAITGGMEAITSRYSILKFEKAFKRGADTSCGEVEADPRFKDDPDFVLNQVAPALLNKMLERLPLLLKEGIDHSVTEVAMQEAQEESRHLWGFVRETGIEAQSGGRIYIKDLWEKLREWYQDNGTLEIEYSKDYKEKLVWNDLPNRYDTPVKAVNQVYARFSEIFPRVQKRQYNERSEPARRGQWYLSGVGYAQKTPLTSETALPPLPVDTERDTALPDALPHLCQKIDRAVDRAVTEQLAEHQTLTQRAGRDGRAVSLTTGEIFALVSQMSESEQQKLSELTEAIAKVKAAKTWTDVQQAIGDDAELREQVKTALTKEENARIGKLKMTAVKPT